MQGEWTIPQIRAAFRTALKSHVLKIRFIKVKDNQERIMRCTLKDEYFPQSDKGGQSPNLMVNEHENSPSLCVLELGGEKPSWKTIKIETLLEVSVDQS